jgi:hypothetical protein
MAEAARARVLSSAIWLQMAAMWLRSGSGKGVG